MKIVHVIGYFQPEFGYKEFYLARNQVQLGHDVSVITSDRMYPFLNVPDLTKKMNVSTGRKRICGFSTIEGIKVYRLPTVFEVRSSILIRGIKKLLKELKPDIVHAYEPSQITPFLAAYYKRLGYFLIADHQQFSLPRTLLGKIFFFMVSRFLSRYMLQKADRIILPTRESVEFAKKHFSIDQKKIAQIPLGFDKHFFFYDASARDDIRSKLNFDTDKHILVTAGKIERGKNFELILRALAIAGNKINVMLLIIGGGDVKYLEELKELQNRLNLNHNIVYLDFVSKEDLHRYYSASDAGIWPELPSITVIEAIGCHLPVILPNRGTVEHLVQDGNGILFERGNPAALAAIFCQVFQSTENLRSMRKMAAIAASRRFDYRKIAQDIVNLAQK